MILSFVSAVFEKAWIENLGIPRMPGQSQTCYHQYSLTVYPSVKLLEDVSLEYLILHFDNELIMNFKG